jgi:hypothetical protein
LEERGKLLFADRAFDRRKLMDKAAYLDFVIEIIRRSDDQRGFQVLPRRWVVERTFGWITRGRRLVRDYETRIDVSEAMILAAMGGNLLRRNAHPRIPKRTLIGQMGRRDRFRKSRRSHRCSALLLADALRFS